MVRTTQPILLDELTNHESLQIQSKARKSKPSARAVAAKESAAIIHTDSTFKEDLIAEAEEAKEAREAKKRWGGSNLAKSVLI